MTNTKKSQPTVTWQKGNIMKQYTNSIVSVEKTGIAYRKANGQMDSTVAVTTADGVRTEVTRRNAKGGYRAGSHWHGDEKCLRTASLICKGASLMDALRANYAKCGVTREGVCWASEYYFRMNDGKLERMTKSAKHETNGWTPAYDCNGKVPQEVLQSFNTETRSASLNGYQTEGEDNNRNASISEAKRKGLLKA